ncbi:MAG: response regulator [Nitrospiraceae bacterium]
MTMMCCEQADLAVTRTHRLSPGVRQDTDPVPLSPASILIVDDDPEVCEALYKILAHRGYRVQAVAYGAEAIQQVSQEKYEAVVLDMKLPDLDGQSVLRAMMELDPKLPIIVLTGYATVENTVGSLVKGAFAYLTKPYNPDEVMAILKRAVAVKCLAVKAEHVEHALSESEDRFRALVESAYGAIIIADEDQVVVSANALARQYFGEECTTMLGCTLGEILPAEVASRSRLLLGPKSRAAEVGGLQQEREFEVNKRLYRYRLFPVAFHGSTSRQIGLVIWDITEEKRLQDQLMQAEKLASLGTLVSGMAHEINNPVQAIYGMAELILEENTSENVKEYARDIYGYSQHIAAVVREFSGYARSASQDRDVDVDVNQRLTDAVKMARRGPYFREVEVVTHFGQVPAVLARRSEIDQLFINLILNAAQAMNGKGRLTLATRLHGQAIGVSISDTGCGIPKPLLNRIFDPFFTTKEPGKGTGLGLSIAHKIVTKYGGKISVESEEEKGATFLIEFPISNGLREREGAPCLACIATTQ